MNATVDHQPVRTVKSGHGLIEVANVAGQSTVTASWNSNPLKILIPRARGESVLAYLSSFGGGLVAGDETKLTVNLGPHTCCFLSTQAATKVYRNPEGHPC